MMLYGLPFIAVALAGLSVWAPVDVKSQQAKLLLAFSGAFLLSVLVFELMPTLFTDTQNHWIGAWVLGGLLLQLLLETASKGAEHGHIHHQKGLPLGLLLSLGLHALVEGSVLPNHDGAVWAVSLHKIPIVLVLGWLLSQTGYKNLKSYGLLLLFGLMTPLGTFLYNQGFDPKYSNPILAVGVGVLLHVSTTILFESNNNHKLKARNFIAILLGFVLGGWL